MREFDLQICRAYRSIYVSVNGRASVLFKTNRFREIESLFFSDIIYSDGSFRVFGISCFVQFVSRPNLDRLISNIVRVCVYRRNYTCLNFVRGIERETNYPLSALSCILFAIVSDLSIWRAQLNRMWTVDLWVYSILPVRFMSCTKIRTVFLTFSVSSVFVVLNKLELCLLPGVLYSIIIILHSFYPGWTLFYQ